MVLTNPSIREHGSGIPRLGERTRSILHYGDQLAGRSPHLEALHLQEAPGGRTLPRYRWSDPSGKPVYRIGIFAGIHGDEPSGVVAALQILDHLSQEADLGRFHEIYVYPVCNPWGFDANRREGESGKDLNRCFWGESEQEEEAEVRLLEQELRAKAFDAIIALHTDDTSEGIYGYVNGSTLTRHLLEPALQAASSILPRDIRPEIDTHQADYSIITGGYKGILSAPPDQHPKPVEIIFETPHHAPFGLQVDAHLAALKEILHLFPQISSQGMDI
jgi:hypothetical protein